MHTQQRRAACLLLFSLVGSLLSACGEAPADADCSASNDTTLKFIAGKSTEAVGGDLTVRGTAQQNQGRAIRRILVAGVEASSDEFNFGAWSATLSFDLLKTLSPPEEASGDDQVNVEVEVIDACNTRHEESFVITLDRNPEPEVTLLNIEPDWPEGAPQYLPEKRPSSIALKIQANPGASGAKVCLEGDEGSFSGTVANADSGCGAQVTLSGDGESNATAVALFSVGEGATNGDRTVFVSASAQGESDVALLRVVAPPSFLPGGVRALEAGDRIFASVTSMGLISTCQATASGAIEVTSGAGDLMASVEVNQPTLDFTVQVMEVVEEDAETVVSCQDNLGQINRVTFRVSAETE